jgi:hypothetical protein
MMQQRMTGNGMQGAVLEKQRLHQAAHILEKYGIDSETDVSDLDQDDFSIFPRCLTSMRLKIFKLYATEHPDSEIRLQIEVMQTEVMKYQALAVCIKSFEERKDSKGKGTFDLSEWWKSNCATLPAFASVLRAVLTNSPNS